MWRAAEDAGVVHMCGFNYRFVPAVRRARELLDAGELGDVVHFRARYLQSWGWERRRERLALRSGAGRDGRVRRSAARTSSTWRATSSARSRRSSAAVRTIVPGRQVDDHFAATVEFENGVVGTLEVSRLARGRINSNAFELNGSEGSIAFDLERFNELSLRTQRRSGGCS